MSTDAVRRAVSRPLAPGSRLLTPESLVLGFVALLVCCLVLYPLLILFFSIFRVDIFGQTSYWTLENFPFLVSDSMLKSILNTLVISTGGTLLATVVGVALAWINARTDTPGRHWLEPLNLVPFFLSPYVGAIAWTYLAAPRSGLLNNLLRQIGITNDPLSPYSLWGMVWVLALFFVPYIFLFTIAPLRRMDASLEEAARTAGCGVLATARRVTLPLILPGILSGMIIVFVSCAGEFGVPLALGHPHGMGTLTTQIFVLTQDLPAKYNRAAAAGAVLASIALVCVWVQRALIARRDFVTVSGKAAQPRLVRLGRWKWATLAFNLVYLGCAVVLPLAALFFASTARSWTGEIRLESMTLDHYAYALFGSPVSTVGIRNSLVLSAVGATLGVVIGLFLAYIIHRTKARGRGALDFISTVPIGVPGIVLAIGILMAYIRTPLYGTLAILLVGYISRYMPYGQRNVSSVLLALSPDLEQSARTAGASWFTTMRRIIVPLVWPGMLSAWVLLFVIFIRELPISILLYTAGQEVFSVAIWRFVENERATRAAALAMIQVVILLVSVIIFRRITRGSEVLV
jgi:iron(III) transport system permease protein